ncbi:MAG: DNA topoisomerase I, partial [Planctomycetaceae bacterium]|nr:DNA topoisomerase I [Planctomycetaceae bacterium]
DADYGAAYLSPEPRQYASKMKNAQEAHEAIRPAGEEMKSSGELGLDGAEARLYDMIWKRTMASQMAEARLRFDTVTLRADDAEFRATGRHIEFPGFFKVYIEGLDDPEAAHEEEESALPELHEQDRVGCANLEAVGHETKPPARYTEATLVGKLVQEGVGRPSTYASIISTIQDRGYVHKSGNQLVPTFTALAVTRLLEDYFPNLVDTQFTAQMEQSLDDISNGEAARLPYLKNFYLGKDGLDEQVKSHEEEIDPRKACTLKLDGLTADIRVGRYGPYLERQENGEKVTAGLPPNIAPADINNETAERLIEEKKKGPQALGMHPEEGLPIFVKRGPFGPYLQLGDVSEEQPKPKRASIPNNHDPDALELETALQLLELPRRIGLHPEDGKVVNAGLGRFGPYVLHAKKYGNFDKKTHTYTTDDGRTLDVLSVDMAAALEMLAKSKSRGKAEPLKVLGEHPDDGKPVEIYEGRYGPYVKHGKTNATVPKETDLGSVTLSDALPWLAAKAGAPSRKKGTKSSARKSAGASDTEAATKAAPRKKAPTKTVAAKKTARKKSKTKND